METPTEPIWPSIDEVKPEEEGGPVARIGFNYQDEIAVGFLIDMLAEQNIIKMHCESHDDILLVRKIEGEELRVAEYIQVKAGELDKLWSIADLCSKQKKEKSGSSIFEISLYRDKHFEVSKFRMVTLRPVVKELKPLTYDIGLSGRDPSCTAMQELSTELKRRFPNLKSKKGNGVDYWIQNCIWEERHSEKAIRRENFEKLFKLAEKSGVSLLAEQISGLLDELRGRAKAAGDAKWDPDKSKKIITRDDLWTWWEGRLYEISEGAKTTSGGKLTKKMDEAGLPSDLISLALEFRREYASEIRSPKYLELANISYLQARVRREVLSLRSRYLAGEFDVDSAGFHSICVEKIETINDETHSLSANHPTFLHGCMYDIADRCLLSFVRQQQ